MENFNQIFTLLGESKGIGLNLDILELSYKYYCFSSNLNLYR